MFVTWPRPRCCCVAPMRGGDPLGPPAPRGRPLCPGRRSGRGCQRVAVGARGAQRQLFAFSRGERGGGGPVPSPPRMPRFPPVGTAGCGAARALPGGGRRPLPGPAPRVGGDPTALRPPPRSALARRSLAVSRLPPLPRTPPTPKSHFPTHAGRVVDGEFWGPDTPPARAPHSGKGPPPLPGTALVYVKNVPFLKRAMADGMGRCLSPASALARPLAA